MAAVDLYGNDANRIRNQYQTSLGRDASDDDVTKWLNGSYGGGGLDQWLQQIASSHEAQQRQQPREVNQPNPNVNTTLPAHTPSVPTNPNSGKPDYSQWYPQVDAWYQQYLGRPGSGAEMEKWLSGQHGYGDYRNPEAIRSAIAGSAEARDRQTTGGAGGTGATGGGYQAFPNNDPFAYITSLTNGRPPTPEQLEALAPQLQQYGITIGSKGSRGWSDTITLPDGRMYDLIEAAGPGTGKRWQFLQVGGPGYTGGGGGVGGGPLPGNQYTDQYTQLLESLMKSRIGMLQQPMNDPYRDQLMAAYQQRANTLGAAAEPQYQDLIKRLEQRFQDLQGPGYTGAENEAFRTQALDPIETDRAAAKQRVIERLSSRGITLESGVAQQALMEVDKAFDGMRAATQTTMATNDVQRREGRQQRADQIKGALYDIPQARAREQLDVFSAMEILEQAVRGDEEARSREAIGYGGALADLGPQRMQLAMQAAGMGGNPQGMFNSLMQMAQLNQNSALLNQRNSGQLWSGLGSLAYTLMNAGR